MSNYGIKVSKQGQDVNTATDKDLIMTSSSNMLKTKASSTFSGVGTVAHGLAYVPVFMIFAKGGTMDRMNLLNNGGADSTNITLEGATDKRYYIFYQDAV